MLHCIKHVKDKSEHEYIINFNETDHASTVK